MSYSRTTWATADVITAAKLNNIESHLEDLADGIAGARRTGSHQSLTQNVDTRLIWNTEDFDPDGLYDPTTGRFTAAIAGVYLFTVSALTAAGIWTSNNQQLLLAYKNGASAFRLVNRPTYRGSGGDDPLAASVLMKLAASDYVEFYLNSANGSPSMVAADTSHLTVARIS